MWQEPRWAGKAAAQNRRWRGYTSCAGSTGQEEELGLYPEQGDTLEEL